MELSKINQEIVDVYHRIKEIKNYDAKNDFDTRGNGYGRSTHIVANIKVYDWLDEDDVKEVIKRRGLEAHENDILEEFNDRRLNSIHEHVCENEVSQIKEEYEDLCHLNDYREQASAYGFWLLRPYDEVRKNLQWYKNHYILDWFKFSERKHSTKNDYFKHLYKQHKTEIDERDRLESIKRDVWQFGRSGGWLSICERDELEDWDCGYYIDTDIKDNTEFNEHLNNDALYRNTKKDLLKELREFISNWETKLETVRFFVSQIENSKKGFKACLLDELDFEIGNFMEDADRSISNVTISIQEDKVKTSLGVSVDKAKFIQAFNILKRKMTKNTESIVPFEAKVGAYHVEFAKRTDTDTLIKAGCHWFSMNNIDNVLNENTLVL